MGKLFETEEKELAPSPVILVGLDSRETDYDFRHSLDEMISLIEACDLEPVCMLTQVLEHPDKATYIGKGKAFELADTVKEFKAEICVFEGNLSPAQMKNLQKIVEVPVWDRTNLILEIFSKRARTREARLQVETAYLQYMLPRLTGMWQHLGRQGGGSGSRSNKGVGETQIELDRRHINHRIAELSRELETITRTRNVQREGRERGNIPSVALVGYTNAGKSSLMNKLLALSGGEEEKQVFEKNMLFATLDTSIRHIYRENKRDFLLSDTVGFIENLPHGLIKAFRSTLDEVKYADLLLIVLDSSDPYHKQHMQVTEATLKELDAGGIPRIYVMNKSDLLEEDVTRKIRAAEDRVYISTKTGSGIDELLGAIENILFGSQKLVKVCIPYSKGELLNELHQNCKIDAEEYTGEGIEVTAHVPERMFGRVEKYIVKIDNEN